MSEFCPVCEDYCDTKTEKVQETFSVKNQNIEVPVTRKSCLSCGEKLGSDEQDQKILDLVNAEYRKRTDLLTPERIKEIRSKYSLSQKCFALLLGMSEATINRYEHNRALQDQAHDTAIRACEDPKFLRDLLERRGAQLTEWQRNRVLKALAGQDTSNSMIPGISLLSMPDEVSERTGFRHFDYNRFAYVVVFLCKEMEEICTTVINKLLFYTDFLNFKTATVSLTGTSYRKLDYGPVPADYDSLLSKMEAEELVRREEKVFPNGYAGFYFKVGPEAGSVQVELTNNEKNVLRFVSNKFKESTATEISDLSHEENAWLNTQDRELISYIEAQFLSLDLP